MWKISHEFLSILSVVFSHKIHLTDKSEPVKEKKKTRINNIKEIQKSKENKNIKQEQQHKS